jgi:hypothetical protein
MSDKQPASKVSLYPVSAAIWRNVNQKGGAFYSATFQRTYKDKEGKYQSSDSFNGSDLLLLAKVADLAHTEIEKLRGNDKEALPEE